MMPYRAIPCPCGHPTCKDWHVSDVASMQGVCFTREQAEAVAGLLNFMEIAPNGAVYTVNILKEFTR